MKGAIRNPKTKGEKKNVGKYRSSTKALVRIMASVDKKLAQQNKSRNESRNTCSLSPDASFFVSIRFIKMKDLMKQTVKNTAIKIAGIPTLLTSSTSWTTFGQIVE